jgi:hypothetical protein
MFWIIIHVSLHFEKIIFILHHQDKKNKLADFVSLFELKTKSGPEADDSQQTEHQHLGLVFRNF